MLNCFLIALSCLFIILSFLLAYLLKISLSRKIVVFIFTSLFTTFLMLSISLSFGLLPNKYVVILGLTCLSVISVCTAFYILLPLVSSKLLSKRYLYQNCRSSDIRTHSFYQKPLKNDVIEVIRAKYTDNKTSVLPTSPNIAFSKKIISGLNKFILSEADKLTLSKLSSFFNNVNLVELSKENLSKNNFELCKLCVKYNYDPVTDSIIDK